MVSDLYRQPAADIEATSEHFPAAEKDYTQHSNYRADIEGLRALAILPVLLFHAGVPGLTGGYVGVDVFFVISGFLITGIIARQVDERRFSIIEFYERRIRRIFPALITVMAFVCLGAVLFYLPSDFKAVPRSIAATLLFCSNILFFMESGYFSTGAHVKLMLHTWSLAVEEQFYLFFPLLLMAIRRLGRAVRVVTVVLIALVSLVASLMLVHRQPDFTFYMLPTRAWELMAGSMLAIGAVPQVTLRWLRELLAAAAVASIAWAVVMFNEATVFPGANALFPVLGAAALIHVAPGTVVGRVLGTAPFRFFGLISYSLYLWHWPLIVLTEYVTDAPLRGWLTVAVIAAAILMATLSWKFVEAPFRSKARFDARAIFILAAVGSVAILGVAGVLQTTRGWPQRFPAQVVALDRSADDVSPRRKACHLLADSAAKVSAPCALGAAVAPATVVWGDSHGVELTYALGEIAGTKGASVAEQTMSSCAPVLDVDIPQQPDCRAHNRRVLDYVLKTSSVKTVVLMGFWADPANGRIPGMAAGLQRTVDALRAGGRTVVVIGPVPPNSVFVPRRLAHLAQAGKLQDARGVTPAELDGMVAYLAPTFANLKARGVTIVQPRDILCEGDACAIQRDGRSLYFDRHHLSLTGARLLAAEVAGSEP
jgi:peptidoglycan/LPS O-acetylase OafA/YrhL